MKKIKKQNMIIGELHEYIKANRAASRNEEIMLYGHPISFVQVWKSKKDYTRKQKHRESFYGE